MLHVRFDFGRVAPGIAPLCTLDRSIRANHALVPRERAEYVAQLAKRQAATWRDIEALIAERNRKGYAAAVALLADLLELAAQKNRTNEFEARVEKLRARHARKPTLIRRLDRAALGPE